MFATMGPGAWVELGVSLGTAMAVLVSLLGFAVGARYGRGTATAERMMQDARIVRAEAERQWTVGEIPTMILPVVPVAAAGLPTSGRPAPRSRR